MKRTPLRRKTPLRNKTPLRSTRPKPRRKPHPDPVTPDVYEDVRARDRGCVGPRVGMPGPCEGPIEEDHVRRGGTGLRSPSRRSNLVCLCRAHHRLKTDNARKWRPPLITYLRETEPERFGDE